MLLFARVILVRHCLGRLQRESCTPELFVMSMGPRLISSNSEQNTVSGRLICGWAGLVFLKLRVDSQLELALSPESWWEESSVLLRLGDW